MTCPGETLLNSLANTHIPHNIYSHNNLNKVVALIIQKPHMVMLVKLTEIIWVVCQWVSKGSSESWNICQAHICIYSPNKHVLVWKHGDDQQLAVSRKRKATDGGQCLIFGSVFEHQSASLPLIRDLASCNDIMRPEVLDGFHMEGLSLPVWNPTYTIPWWPCV